MNEVNTSIAFLNDEAVILDNAYLNGVSIFLQDPLVVQLLARHPLKRNMITQKLKIRMQEFEDDTW